MFAQDVFAQVKLKERNDLILKPSAQTAYFFVLTNTYCVVSLRYNRKKAFHNELLFFLFFNEILFSSPLIRRFMFSL